MAALGDEEPHSTSGTSTRARSSKQQWMPRAMPKAPPLIASKAGASSLSDRQASTVSAAKASTESKGSHKSEILAGYKGSHESKNSKKFKGSHKLKNPIKSHSTESKGSHKCKNSTEYKGSHEFKGSRGFKGPHESKRSQMPKGVLASKSKQRAHVPRDSCAAERQGVHLRTAERLEEHMLTWSFEDILNEKLLADQVRPIPTTFPDLPTYLSAFRWPLIEECRASLQRGLEQLPAPAPTRIVIRALGSLPVGRGVAGGTVAGVRDGERVEGSGLKGGRDGTGGFQFVDFQVSGGRGGGGEKLKPTDVVVLSPTPLTRPTDLLCPGVLYRLGLLIPKKEDDGCLRVKLSLREDSPEWQQLKEAVRGSKGEEEQEGAEWCMTAVDSFATPLRVWGALHEPLEEEQGGSQGAATGNILATLLCSKGGQQGRLKTGVRKGGGREAREHWSSPPPPPTTIAAHHVPGILQAVVQFCTARHLNHSQQAAVLACITSLLPPAPSSSVPAVAAAAAVASSSTATPASSASGGRTVSPSAVSSPTTRQAASPGSQVQLVQGPPGTGKTQMLSVLLSVALSLGVRSLVCAPTNVAAAEVARRMLHLARSPDPSLQFSGFCHALDQAQAQAQAVAHAESQGVAEAASVRAEPMGAGMVNSGEGVQALNGLPGGSNLRVGDVVLVANEERLEVDEELDSLLLGREDASGGSRSGRLWRLHSALGLSTGWRGGFSALMTLVQLSGEQLTVEHQKRIEELEQKGEGEAEVQSGGAKEMGKNKTSKGQSPSLLDFYRERTWKLIRQAREAAATLAQDIPSALLPEDHRQLLLQAGELLTALRHVLACPGLSPAALLLWLDSSEEVAVGVGQGMTAVLREVALLARVPCDNREGTSPAHSRSGRHSGKESSSSGQRQLDSTSSTSISLSRAQHLFHSIRTHLHRIYTESPAFHFPALGSSLSPSTIAAACVNNARLVLSTVSSSARHRIRSSGTFPLLLLDEAAQVVEAEALVALQAPGVRYAVLVGDPKQLPATVLSKVAAASHYNRSLFERLQGNGWGSQLLSVQYRMHPAISHFPSHCFYRGRIQNGANVCHPLHSPRHLEPLFGPYRFFHVKGKEERDSVAGDGGNRSIANSTEAALVLSLLHRLAHACRGAASVQGRARLKVGLISPYARQVERLQSAVQSGSSGAGGSSGSVWGGVVVEVKTVDGFQGRECDVIILTTVRCNRGGSIGFVADPRRLNVAVTRARCAMWVVGDSDTLRRGNRTWEQLLLDAHSRGCLVNAQSDARLRGAVKAAGFGAHPGWSWEARVVDCTDVH